MTDIQVHNEVQQIKISDYRVQFSRINIVTGQHFAILGSMVIINMVKYKKMETCGHFFSSHDVILFYNL